MANFINDNSLQAKFRLNLFHEKFDQEFPLACMKISAGVIVRTLLDVPLLLYATNLNGPAITELHSILERYAIRDVSRFLSTPSGRPILYKILERSTLPYLAEILCEDLHVWDLNDVGYAKKLNAIRNGIAHKNPRPISNTLLSGRKIHFLDIDHEMESIECIPFLIGSIRLLHKLFRVGGASKNLNNIEKEHD